MRLSCDGAHDNLSPALRRRKLAMTRENVLARVYWNFKWPFARACNLRRTYIGAEHALAGDAPGMRARHGTTMFDFSERWRTQAGCDTLTQNRSILRLMPCGAGGQNCNRTTGVRNNTTARPAGETFCRIDAYKIQVAQNSSMNMRVSACMRVSAGPLTNNRLML